MRAFFNNILNLLENPRQIFLICLFFGLLGTFFDGTLYRIWQLKNESLKVKNQISSTKKEIEILGKQIQSAHDPRFIEREARDRFDLVGENDIVFVFAE
jgi:cell division protein FtsB